MPKRMGEAMIDTARYGRALLALALASYWIVSLGVAANDQIRLLEPESAPWQVVMYSTLGSLLGLALSSGFVVLGFRTRRPVGMPSLFLAGAATLLMILDIGMDHAERIVFAFAALVLLGDGFRRMLRRGTAS